MESYTLKKVTFFYPKQTKAVLDALSFSINKGEFVTLCGPSGCGKTTLLRQLKTVLAPYGTVQGEILFEGKSLSAWEQRIQSSKIGVVMQSPDNQIVTDKVWHELAFGLESLGIDTPTIRLRVAEIAAFFGIESWFHKSVAQLSGGQKQLLNLASIMAMQPSVLILDEPTSQLDPIAAAEFLATLGRINRELGVTVIMTEHRLEEVFSLTDRVLVLDEGRLIGDGTPQEIGTYLKNIRHSMFLAMPIPMQIYARVDNQLECPITVRDGRTWLDAFVQHRPLNLMPTHSQKEKIKTYNPIITLEEVWFRYEQNATDVLKGMSMQIYEGELLAILGGNGAGKSTMLSLICGENTPYRGMVNVAGHVIGNKRNQVVENSIGMLPQNPQTLFSQKTVFEDLVDGLGHDKEKKTRQEQVQYISQLCQLDKLLTKHPYDLSGGEQQRLALAKVLLLEPKILMLDEPTKGLDAHFKSVFAGILHGLLQEGVTIIMVSHDIEFCAKYAKRCALFFDGKVVSENNTRNFFTGNNFYTTSANRMARQHIIDAMTPEDVISACGGDITPLESVDFSHVYPKKVKTLYPQNVQTRKKDKKHEGQVPIHQRYLSTRTLLAMIIIFLTIPLTMYIGIYYLGDRKYYFISMLIILQTMLPFVLVFEHRKPLARELIVIAVLCAIGVAGRAAFFMVPQFKPVVAIVIIAGVAFGAESGFLVGAIIAFVSNMFFGQGPWTPWQMFALGIIGFIAGILFQKGVLRKKTIELCVFGGISTFFIYGGIMNPAAVLMFQSHPTKEMFVLAYLRGIPFDLIHAVATVFFLFVIARPMLEKLERIKEKYGLIKAR